MMISRSIINVTPFSSLIDHRTHLLKAKTKMSETSSAKDQVMFVCMPVESLNKQKKKNSILHRWAYC